ncbi:MAG TPA: secretion protein HlyD, partial [Bryobacteraceae bacterium]
LAIPIQALTMRQRKQLETGKPGARPQNEAAQKAANEELQGVFLVRNGKAVFQKVDTGITGATNIEVLHGLQAGDQIVTGNYQAIRTLRNEAKVKVNNNPGEAQHAA